MPAYNPNQGSLIVLQRGGSDMFVRDFANPASGELAVTLVERAIHLQNTLGFFSVTNRANGFLDRQQITQGEIAARARYKDAYSQVVTGSVKTAEQSFGAAKTEFAKAVGAEVLGQSGLVDPKSLADDTEADFLDFWRQYGLPSKHQANNRLWTRLFEDIRRMQSNQRRSER